MIPPISLADWMDFRIEKLKFDGHVIRLLRVGNAWWIHADDAGRVLTPMFGSRERAEAFINETEAHARHVIPPSVKTITGEVISTRSVVERLALIGRPPLQRFRTWLEAWKIIGGASSG